MLKRDALNNLCTVKQIEPKCMINNVFANDALSVKTIQGDTKLIGQTRSVVRKRQSSFYFYIENQVETHLLNQQY